MIKIKDIEEVCERVWKAMHDGTNIQETIKYANNFIPNNSPMGWELFSSIAWFYYDLNLSTYKSKMIEIIEILYEV